MDLNLLLALDALLAECSITGAARRLGLSASAMSRTLIRLRSATGDPLLVRAGRDMVLTPHAETLRTRTRAALLEAQTLLSPAPAAVDLATVQRTFRIRANEAFVEVFGATLIAAAAAQAPRVRLHFSGKPDRKSAYLRNGDADLEIGVVEDMGPEVRVRALFRDRYVGVVRAGHPLSEGEAVTATAYAAFPHVATPHGRDVVQALDAAMSEQGLQRTVAAVVPGFPAALAVALDSNLVALLPRSFMAAHRPPGSVQTTPGAHVFELPVPLEGFSISLMWHPRVEADAVHRWLRELIVAQARARIAL
jgi:DNA-binding transcriptional LysR family regulator